MQYSASFDINLIDGIDNKSIKSIQNVYYATKETDKKNIPVPFSNHEDNQRVLYMAEGIPRTRQGIINYSVQFAEWTYDKPEFEYGLHLWTCMEITTEDGTIIYSEPQLFAEWESYYNLEIGGSNLIRNSKTLIDEKIYFI